MNPDDLPNELARIAWVQVEHVRVVAAKTSSSQRESMQRVIEVPVPPDCGLARCLQRIDFCDAYEAPLRRRDLSVEEIYAGVFGSVPVWAKGLMALRGAIAVRLGLKHPKPAAINSAAHHDRSLRPRVGERVGLFTLQSVSPSELIAGDDDSHLNFRVSIYRSSRGGLQTVTVSTAVEIHNFVGRAYMAVVRPFHRVIVKSMLQRAVDSGRI